MTDINKLYYEENLPNKNEIPSRSRKKEHPPLGIIIHSMSQKITHDGIKKFAPEFLHDVGLSAHAFVDVNGTQILGVNTNRVAYHAGKSHWNGHSGLNNRWLGIEVLVEGNHDWGSFVDHITHKNPFTTHQYKSTVILCKKWMEQYPSIKKENIVGHSQVSGKDVRSDPKIDPGDAWNWKYFWKWFDMLDNPIDSRTI